MAKIKAKTILKMGNIILYILVGIAVLGMIISMWNDSQDNKRIHKEVALRNAMGSQHVSPCSQVGTRDMFLDTLTKIGCQYKLDEGDDNRIYFVYQGEHFFANTSNDIRYVHLWDAYWQRVDLSDIDEVSRLRKAINLSNINTTVTTVFTIDDEGKYMDVHTKSTIPFIYSMPGLDEYLKSELSDFFKAHQEVGNELLKLREKDLNA